MDEPRPRTAARFDALKAWNGAVGAIRANRETLLVLAGLFFLLPQLLLGFVLPDAPTGVEDEELMKRMSQIYADHWPLFLGWILLQATGTLCVIVLLADRARPTVAQAIRRAARLLPYYFAAQLVIAAGIGIGFLLLLTVLSLMGSEALVVLGAMAAVPLAIWIFVRTFLTAPVIVARDERNPFEAIKRSWRLTEGAGARLLLFFALVVLCVAIIDLVLTTVPGALVAAVAGPGAAAIYAAIVGSIISALFALLVAALLVAVHNQLHDEEG